MRGNIVEQTCIITDTRLKADGSCPGTLNIAALCPGFPGEHRAGDDVRRLRDRPRTSSPSCRASPTASTTCPGIMVQSEASPAELIPGTADIGCTNASQVVGWTPRLDSDEGVTPEGARGDRHDHLLRPQRWHHPRQLDLGGRRAAEHHARRHPRAHQFTNQKLATSAPRSSRRTSPGR